MNRFTAVESPPILERLSNLADTTRSRLLVVLQDGEFTVSELCSILQLPQSTVSRHLKVLTDDGWLVSTPDGTSRRYQMVAELDGPTGRLWALVREQLEETPAARQDARRVESVLATRHSRSREFFAEAAGEWDERRRELFGARADLQALLGLLDRDWVVGDLGCGTGSLTAVLAPFVGRVIGVDRSEAMLEAGRERLASRDNVELRRGELERLPVEDDTLDVAVVYLVLHHVVEPERVLAEVARVLRPGGRLLVADMTPHDRTGYRNEMGHVWLGFSKERLCGWLRSSGFGEIVHRDLPPDPDARGPALFTASALLTERPPTADHDD